jgi:hypothetical protein
LEIEPSKTGNNELKLTKGLFIKRGWVNVEFCSSDIGDSIEQTVTLDYPLILVVQDSIGENEDIIRIMDMAKKNKRSLLVFSMNLMEGPLSVMLFNVKKSNIEA